MCDIVLRYHFVPINRMHSQNTSQKTQILPYSFP